MPLMTILKILQPTLFILAAVQLIRIGRAKKLPNLYWLAANFLFATAGSLMMNIIPHPAVQVFGLILSALCTVMFIQQTFYRDRKSPYLFIIGLVILMGAFQLWTIFFPVPGRTLTPQFAYLFVWGWQALIGFRAYRQFSGNRTIEDWVKSRYLLWTIYSTVMFILVARALIPVTFWANEVFLTLSLVILAALMQYLTWGMPESLRLFLNRNYKPAAVESISTFANMSEKELLQHIQSQAK